MSKKLLHLFTVMSTSSTTTILFNHVEIRGETLGGENWIHQRPDGNENVNVGQSRNRLFFIIIIYQSCRQIIEKEMKENSGTSVVQWWCWVVSRTNEGRLTSSLSIAELVAYGLFIQQRSTDITRAVVVSSSIVKSRITCSDQTTVDEK